MRRGAALAAALAVVTAAGVPAAGAAAAASPERLEAQFVPRADGSAALRVSLQVDPDRGSATRSLRLWLPRGVGIATSGLGTAACRLPAAAFADVLVTPRTRCPRNALLGLGRGAAIVRLDGVPPIRETALLSLYAGPLRGDRLGLVAFVDGLNPFGARLALRGEIRPVGGRYEGVLLLEVPQIPELGVEFELALTDVRLTIGDRRIRYAEASGTYRPSGLAPPASCTRRGGAPFRAEVTMLDGSRVRLAAAARC